jgi:uncharacterized protein (DUF1778 family)
MSKVEGAGHMSITSADRETEESRGTISFSVRLTDKQRDVLARAAEKRGWSLTSLLKNAALEKAVHILNTSAPNKIDFRGTAQEIARQVFTPRSGRRIDHDDDNVPVRADVCESLEEAYKEQIATAIEVAPWQQPPAFVSAIRDAARYGGTEFLELIIQASEAITARHDHRLPDPIDPSSI